MFSRAIALAMLAVGAGAGVSPVVNTYRVGSDFVAVQSSQPARKKKAVRIGGGYFGPRSKGPPAKPKRKTNRLHISRRVRRKHRRARKAA